MEEVSAASPSALTGFGNRVLEGLAASPRVDRIAVISRVEAGPFPYYPCEPFPETCRRLGVPLYLDRPMADPATGDLVAAFAPDVILAATFHEKIPAAVTALARVAAVNLHPSLLPKYRGPTPTHWAVINGETASGITYHRLTDRLDAGEVLWQVSAAIGGLTDGQVRRRLARLAGQSVGEFLERLAAGRLRPRPQPPGEPRPWPHIASRKALDLLRSGSYSSGNIVRGLTPYPGPELLR